MTIAGECDRRFQAVRDEFERNFRERGEIGASVCIIVEGRAMVDLWGGIADRSSARQWERDTIGMVWSCTKGAVALCAHLLVSRGLLDLDAPVARYWPEFAQHGKETIPVRWLLNHQAGLPAVHRPLRTGGLFDWNYMVETLAEERPFWEPGTRQGYHAFTFGHLVGEVVRRISGRELGTFFREEISGPLKLDFHLGLLESEEPRVTPTIRPDPVPTGETPWRFLTRLNQDPDSVQALIMRNTGLRTGEQDSRHAHATVLPSQGGITNARGLAGMYAALSLGGMKDGIRLLDAGTLQAMGTVSSATAVDAVLLVGLRFGLGFMKSSDNRRSSPGATDSLILSEAAFGHAGMGGSLGFADPPARLAFGYTMNKQGRGVLLNERGQALVDAVYQSLGCRSNQRGYWA